MGEAGGGRGEARRVGLAMRKEHHTLGHGAGEESEEGEARLPRLEDFVVWIKVVQRLLDVLSGTHRVQVDREQS